MESSILFFSVILSLLISVGIFGATSTPSLFLYSILLFQVVPVLYGLYTGFYDYDLTRQINMLTVGTIAFILGYLPFGLARNKALNKISDGYLMAKDSRTVFKVALLFSILLFPVTASTSIQFFLSRRGGQYGLTEPISSLEQLFYYTALGFFYLALSVNLRHIPLKWLLLLVAVVLLPRLLITLIYSRIFIFLALVPLFYALYFSRLNFKLSISRATLAFLILGLFVIVPALTRDTSILASQQRFEALVMNGSSIPILEKYERYGIEREQSFVFASVVLKTIPFPIPLPENYRVNVWGMEGAVATLDRVLSSYENQGREDVFFGTGSNFLHELYIDFGWMGVILGSILVGLFAAYVEYRGVTSLFFRFLWLSILTSFLFLPRSNTGYFLEKLPLYIAFYILAWLAIKLIKNTSIAARKRYAKT